MLVVGGHANRDELPPSANTPARKQQTDRDFF
jgi:hypothetical protein